MRDIGLMHRIAACLLLFPTLSTSPSTARADSSALSDRDLAVWRVAFEEFPPLPPIVNGIPTLPPVERLILNETLPSSAIRNLLVPVADEEFQELVTDLLRRNESSVTLMKEALASFAFPFVDIMSIRSGTRLDLDVIRDRFGGDDRLILLWVSLPSFSEDGRSAAVFSIRIRASDGSKAADFDHLYWSEGRWQVGYSASCRFTDGDGDASR